MEPTQDEFGQPINGFRYMGEVRETKKITQQMGKMTIKEGAISILVNREGTTIELTDKTSNTRFAEVKLTNDQLAMALARFGETPCKIDVFGLDRIGKTHEHKNFEFAITRDLEYGGRIPILQKMANELLLEEGEGWSTTDTFSSQNTFFEKDGKKYARCIARRYV